MPVRVHCPNPDCQASFSVLEGDATHFQRCPKCGCDLAGGGGTQDLARTDAAYSPQVTANPAPPSPSRLAPGSSFAGRYTVIKLLGRGGMGIVYLARDTRLDRDVALKLPYVWGDEDSEFLRRFYREARAAASLRNPRICAVHDVGESQGQPFLVMAYIEGELLSDHIKKRNGPTEPQEAVRLVRQVAQAMAAAHARGIIHRDLKPANIMLDPEVGPIIMDFGLARREDRDDSVHTQAGQLLGTPAYMPLEQFEGRLEKIGVRSDIYSLGVILFELLTGRPPHAGKVHQIYDHLKRSDLPLPSSLSRGIGPALDRVCRKAMAKEPEDRYASMGEFDLALKEAADLDSHPTLVDESSRSLGDEGSAPAPTVVEPSGLPAAPGPRQKPRWGAAIAVAALVPLLGVGVFVWMTNLRREGDVNPPAGPPPVRPPEPPRAATRPEPATSPEPKNTPATAKEVVATKEKPQQPAPAKREEPPPVKQPDSHPVAVAAATTTSAPKPEPATPKPEPAAPKVATPTPKPAALPREFASPATGMTFVRVDPGQFLMGSPDSDKDAEDDEKPAHLVRITRPFYLGKHEVTVGQFRRFAKATLYRTQAEREEKGGWGWSDAKKRFEQHPSYTWRNPGFSQDDQHPVVNVSWNDAVAFCDWLGKEDGQVYRLPTEAEWEYACRAGSATRYSSGDAAETLKAAGNVADDTARRKYRDWFTISGSDGFVHTAPAGKFQSNRFGLHDMHGNVWEWCADPYAKDYYKGSPEADPPGPSQAADRVIRGGCWFGNPRYARSAERAGFAPDFRSPYLGFRVVRVPPGR
jgi:formylglycine-generating enzyme required for sulfatase activity